MENYMEGLVALSNSRTFFSMDNWMRVKFWKDKLCGDEPMCISFPSLYALALLKEA